MTGPESGSGTAGVVGIVGLGLIGGSLARALAGAGWRVQGTDRNEAVAAAAREAGIVEGPIDAAAVDVVVLAVPVRAVPAWLRALSDQLPPEAVVTDVGSTKRSIVEAAEATGLGRAFVGAHPMAGDHRSGWDAARPDLFEGARVWICPAREAGTATVARIEALWRAVGARPERMDPVDHDRLMARASHLPQAVATALAGALAGDGVGPGRLGPGGRDTTRLAGSDPDVWTDILMDNGDQVEEALSRMLEELERLRRAIHGLDDATVRSVLEAGRAWRRGPVSDDTADAARPITQTGR